MLSRAADAMYWLSRYLERAEHTARLLDVHAQIALDEAPWAASVGWICVSNGLRLDVSAEKIGDTAALVEALVCDPGNPTGILGCIARARENARQIREQVSSDMWEALNALYLSVRAVDSAQLQQQGPHLFLRGVQRGVQLFTGVADATMPRGEGWQFLRLGRFIERAINLAWLLDAHFGIRGSPAAGAARDDDFVAWSGLLRACNAFEAYCKAHTVELRPERILTLLLLDAEFPFSTRFAAQEIDAALGALAEWTGTPRTEEVRRLGGRLAARLSFGAVSEILSEDISRFLNDIVNQCLRIHEAVYARYVTYPIAAALTGAPGPAAGRRRPQTRALLYRA